jgi:hypothetical protein
MAEALLERAAELEKLRALVAAPEGTGNVVVIEGPAGIGKTALLEFACACAREGGLRVLSARGSEFRRIYPWGIVRSLFAPALALPEAERDQVFHDAAALAEAPLGFPSSAATPASNANALGAALHGIYWALANLALTKGLLVAVDDAHWADGPSLRWLEYLAASIDEIPVLLCVALDHASATDNAELLLSLSARATTLTLPPLSVAGTERLVEQRLGPAPGAALGATCHAETGGNPFLLNAVLDELCERGGDVEAAPLDELESGAISRALDRRLARLPPAARDLAASVAILGGASRLLHAAALAGINDEDGAGRAADALTAAGLVRPGEPLEFVQPITRAGGSELDSSAQAKRMRPDRGT